MQMQKPRQRGSFFDPNTSDGLLRALAVLFPSISDTELIEISRRFFPTRSVDAKVISKLIYDMKAMYSTRRGQFAIQLKKLHIELPIEGLEKHVDQPPLFKVSEALRDKILVHCQELIQQDGEAADSNEEQVAE